MTLWIALLIAIQSTDHVGRDAIQIADLANPILSVACLAWLARFLTSAATTAKPRPASPARADSIVALSASRLIWPVISPIS